MKIVIAIILQFCLCLLINYAKDRPSFPNGRIYVSMPSVRDLPENSNVFVIDRYIEEEIFPAYNYFREIKTIETEYRSNDFVILYILPGLLALSEFISLIKQFSQIIAFFREHDVLSVLFTNAVLAIWLLVCLFLSWLAKKVYKKHFSIDGFSKTSEQLNKMLVKTCEDFNISEDRYMENQCIHIYYRYILEYRDKTKQRILATEMLKVLSNIAWIAYPLFFIFLNF